MCLAFPQKVVGFKNGMVAVESFDGTGRMVKNILKLEIGDYVLVQQNVAIERVSAKEAEEIIGLLTKK